MQAICPKCGVPCGKGDLFCRKCGTKVTPTAEIEHQGSPFETEVISLMRTLKKFRAWIDQEKRKNVRFMRAYKEKIEKEVRPSIKEFREKYAKSEEGESPLFRLVLEAFSAFSRPISLMETELRPSVGMGVFLERWMITKAAEDYLKECCQEADRLLEELTKRVEVRSQKSGVRMEKEVG